MTDPVRRAQAGDQAAFAEVYREYAGRVYALCLRLAGNASEAETLVQDVFVRVWERLSSFRGESAFASWLHRVTVNVVLEGRRMQLRREARVLPVEDPEALERGVTGDTVLGIDLERAIASLPEGAREVFILYDVEGYGHAEIAAMTGIAEGTSKAQLFRARRLLRKALER